MAEKIVTDEEEVVLMMGPLSSGSLHSMGTHDSSSSLDWALDAAASKVRPRSSDLRHHKLSRTGTLLPSYCAGPLCIPATFLARLLLSQLEPLQSWLAGHRTSLAGHSVQTTARGACG